MAFLFPLFRPVRSFFAARELGKTGRNKYDTILETTRPLMSLFRPLLNYKLWQSYFPFNEPDVWPWPLISHRHLGVHEIFHGSRRKKKNWFDLSIPIERARATEVPIILNSCFLHIDVINSFLSPFLLRIYFETEIMIGIMSLWKTR